MLMNIAIFTDTYFPDINGVTSSIHTLSEELRKRGHTVYVFTVSEPRSVMKQLKKDPSVYRFPSIPIVFIKPHRAAAPFSIRLFRLVKKFKIDIIHTQTEFFMAYFGMSAATSFRIPIIHTYHTMLEDYTHYVTRGIFAKPVMARQYTRAFCNMVSTIIVPTEKVKSSLRSYGVKKPIYVIPTGINLEPFRKDLHSSENSLALKQKLNIDPSWPIILSVGRVAKEKSLDVLIEKMPDVLKLVPDARLIVVGTGPAKEKLEEMSDTLGISDHVIFLGAVPYREIGSYYRLGDVFVCCSTTETQGLTYYEAMAAGVPIIARRDDCIRKIIRDRKDGVQFDTPESLPEMIRDILEHPETAAMYARNAYEAVKAFSSETFGQRVEDIYLHTIDRMRVKKAQRKDSIVRIPVPGALRHLRLVMMKPSNNKKRNKSRNRRESKKQKN